MGKNPIMEKSDAGAACLSWTFFFSIILSVTILYFSAVPSEAMLHRVPSYRRSCGLESLPGPEIWEAALPKHCNLSRILPILVANSEFMFHSAGFLRHPRLLTTPSSYSLFAGPTGIPWDRSCRKAVATLKIVGTRVETKGGWALCGNSNSMI